MRSLLAHSLCTLPSLYSSRFDAQLAMSERENERELHVTRTEGERSADEYAFRSGKNGHAGVSERGSWTALDLPALSPLPLSCCHDSSLLSPSLTEPLSLPLDSSPHLLLPLPGLRYVTRTAPTPALLSFRFLPPFPSLFPSLSRGSLPAPGTRHTHASISCL